MIRSSILASSLLAVAVLTGCDKAADDQKKIDTAYAEADKKIADATKDADQKIKTAQAEADKKIADAEASFMKLREDFRHSTTTNLLDLDRKIDALVAKAKVATGKAKTDLDASLTSIRASRATLASGLKSLDTASAQTWDDTKARVEKQWTELKALVDKAP